MKNLVISPIGENSLHREWLAGDREFDFMGIYYGDNGDKYKEDCDYYIKAKGLQWKLNQDVYINHKDILCKYDAIWCPGDDISMSTESINRAFSIFHEYKLRLAMPSLSPGPGCSLPITNPEKGTKIRYTNFVEALAPIFTYESFEYLHPTFTESISAWGIDWVWCKLLDFKDIAIIDEVTMVHTKPVGIGASYKKLKELGMHPGDELNILLKKYNIIADYQVLHRVFK